MRNTFVLAAVLVLSLSSSAHAQFSARSWELQLQGSLTLDNSDQGTSFGSIILRPGWFITDHHEIGLTITGTLIDDKLTGDVGPFYTYNFDQREAAPFTPYLLTGLTTSLGGSEDPKTPGEFSLPDKGNVVSLGGGMRFPLTAQDTFSISAETEYSIDETEFSDQIRIQFGFSHFLGSGKE